MGVPMSDIYIDFYLTVVSDDRAQAWATITRARKGAGGGAEYTALAKGTSGLLSDVPPDELMRRAAEDAMGELERVVRVARDRLVAQGLLKAAADGDACAVLADRGTP